MDILFSLFAGAVQGLTEFLPISSSGHLVLLHDLFGFSVSDELAFDVVLHIGTLAALLAFFYADAVKYSVAFVKSAVSFSMANDDQRLAWYLFLATIPAAAVGYFFEDVIESDLRIASLVAIMMIVVGVLLIIADRLSARSRSMQQMTLPNALVIGVAQVLALIPGTSRSGITIIAGLSQKLNRHDAAKFSFLLSMPVIFGAGVKQIFELLDSGIDSSQFGLMATGFLASAITGYFCIAFFLKFLQKHSLAVFGYYRIVVGVAIIAVLFFSQSAG